MENALRNFATLTKDDVISINYNEKDYELSVLETKPGNAVSIIECDMDVDFAPPIGYEEPNYKKGAQKPSTSQATKAPVDPKQAAKAEGYRLDGKEKKKQPSSKESDTKASTSSAAESRQSGSEKEVESKGKPFYDYKVGLIRFHHNFEELSNQMVFYRKFINFFFNFLNGNLFLIFFN